MVSFNWEAPRCLVSSDPGGLKVVRSTIDLLKKIKVKVTVVSIAGPYRTGKSYLMNRLAGKNTGFDIGSTIQAETKGIWAWCRPHPMDRDTCLLLLDTEGLGDPEKGDKNYDAWIFTLAVLLSTTLVYNTLGTINQDALNELHLVTKLSEHMRIRSNANNDTQNFGEFFPNFVWTVRDFWLDMVIDGKPCTANEYMEKMLELRKGVDWKTKEYNKVRHCVRRYFPSRNCFVFPRPVKDMEKIKTPERLTYPDFEVEFLKVSEGFIDHIRDTTDSRAKSIFGAPLTGSALAGLCEHYVQKIQEGGIPCIENGVETISERENEKAMKDAIQFYKMSSRGQILLELSRRNTRSKPQSHGKPAKENSTNAQQSVKETVAPHENGNVTQHLASQGNSENKMARPTQNAENKNSAPPKKGQIKNYSQIEGEKENVTPSNNAENEHTGDRKCEEIENSPPQEDGNSVQEKTLAGELLDLLSCSDMNL